MNATIQKTVAQMQRDVKKRNDNLKGGAFWRNFDFFICLIAVVIFALAIKGAIVEPVRVVGSSMSPTFSTNDYVFVEKVTFAFRNPQHGEVVICYYPDSAYGANQSYTSRIKRVVGVAGDAISADEEGYLVVNGERVEESYLPEGRTTPRLPDGFTVPDGYVYVLGDNRSNSTDSRAVGALPLNKIVGKVQFVMIPGETVDKIAVYLPFLTRMRGAHD